MVDTPTFRFWMHQGLFLFLALLTFVLALLPLPREAGRLPGPDLLLALSMVWLVRRPDYLPVALVALVFFAQDLLLSRPPGVWSMLVILATEFLRSRRSLTLELNFVVEWLLVAALILWVLVMNRVVLAVFLVPQPVFGQELVKALWTIAAYPVLAFLCRIALGFDKSPVGFTDDFGRQA